MDNIIDVYEPTAEVVVEHLHTEIVISGDLHTNLPPTDFVKDIVLVEDATEISNNPAMVDMLSKISQFSKSNDVEGLKKAIIDGLSVKESHADVMSGTVVNGDVTSPSFSLSESAKEDKYPIFLDKNSIQYKDEQNRIRNNKELIVKNKKKMKISKASQRKNRN